MATHLVTGSQGEELAAQFLAARGYAIVERRVRCGRGDIDLVCQKDGELIFVEVKTRNASAFGSAIDALSAKKIAALSRSINHYVYQNGLERARIRCDLVAVDIDKAGHPAVNHIRAAFMPVATP